MPAASTLRLLPEALQRYLCEEQLAWTSEGKATPTWRERLTEELASLKDSDSATRISDNRKGL
ncbi:MAG: hypothetical protein GY856_25270 [bacterium]|nr:hypothetical protein [bacterium]